MSRGRVDRELPVREGWRPGAPEPTPEVGGGGAGLGFPAVAGVAAGAQPDGRGAAVGRDGALLPHVVAWNLTKRCNLACAHCYIAAGSWHAARDELSTATCLRILDELLEVNPAPMLILSGGEPLLREDLEEIAHHASEGGATVVVGTNGTRLTDARIQSLQEAGVRGVAVSVDSLDPGYHDRFRHGPGSLEETLAAVSRLREHRLDFVIQTSLTRGNRRELEDLAEWASAQGALSFNLYFLVGTGRGERMKGLAPEENEEVLRELVALEARHRGRMMIRSKCQPQIMRVLLQTDPESGSPLLHYRTRCPCGVQYCRITPEGKVTPCPYTPVVAGDLTTTGFADVWWGSPVFRSLREEEPGGKCGRCEYRKVCGGCRARAYAEGAGLMGPDEACAYDPPGDRPVVEPPREITYGAPVGTSLEWTPGARERLERIPSFVRGVVARRVETFAGERGYPRVDTEVMAEVRRSLPVDFSRRLPFFLRRGDEG